MKNSDSFKKKKQMHFEKEKEKKLMFVKSTMCQVLWQGIYTYNLQQQVWDIISFYI